MNNNRKIFLIAGVIILGIVCGLTTRCSSGCRSGCAGNNDGLSGMIITDENGEMADILSVEAGETVAYEVAAKDDNNVVTGKISSTVGETEETNNMSQSAKERADSEIVVYICGYVNNPDVYTISIGARVADVINLAGGFTEEADINYINLAYELQDGMKIYVPSLEETGWKGNAEPEKQENKVGAIDYNSLDPNQYYSDGLLGNQQKNETEASNISSNSDSKSNSKLVNLNTASKEELMTLPGVGESKANAIISYREMNGNFKSIEGIMNITGIKEGLFNKIKDYITVG